MSRRLARAGEGHRWLVSFAVMTVVIGGWSLASPLFSSPDEPAHVVKAAAVARGQLLGNRVEGDPVLRTVRIPAIFDVGHQVPECYKFKPEVSAACGASFTGSTRTIDARTHVGSYPPLYYFLVGLPSLVAPSATGVYAMRLFSAVLAAAFLAWALTGAARFRSPILLAGVAAAATPMVLYFGASVNPNSLEISAAICLWVCGLVLLAGNGDERTGLVAPVGLSAAVLVSMRGLSPLLLAVIALVLAAVTRRDRWLPLLRQRAVKAWLAIAVASAMMAVAWILLTGTLELPRFADFRDLSTSAAARQSLGKSDGDIRQMIGVFGWLDTPSPALTMYLWFFVVGSLFVLALAAGTGRLVSVLTVLAVTAVLLPRLLEFPSVQRYGFAWQGRYGLPVAVGVPILAAFVIGSRPDLLGAAAARTTRVMVGLLGAGHVAAFVVALRRYMVGVAGPIAFTDGPWQPPLPAAVLVLGFILAIATWAWWLAQLAAGTAAPEADPDASFPEDPDLSDAAVDAAAGGR